jgi:hypothetical protein
MKDYDPLTYQHPRSMEEAFDERGPLVEMDAKPNKKTALKYVAAIWLVFTVVIGYEMTGMAFQKGFEQGYIEGRERALMDDQLLYKHCTAWWFNGSEPLAIKEINKYCDRRSK